MRSEPEFDVFLAHYSGDKPLVLEISNRLKKRGLKPWIDEEQIAPGVPFQKAIQEAIPKVKTAAIILGVNRLGRWQDLEIRTFFSQFVNKGTSVIPVLLPGVAEVPENLAFLKELRWINFNGPDDTNALDLLVWGITGKRPEEALEDSPTSETNTPTIQPSSFDADTYFNQALAQSELNNYQEAIKGYTQAIQLKPDYAEAYFHRGRAHFHLEDDQGAIKDFTQAIQLKPDYAEAYFCRGIARSDLEDNQVALQDFTQAIQLKPDWADAYFHRGVACGDLEDYQGALQDFTQAIQLKPDYADAYRMRGIIRSHHPNLEDYQGAKSDWQKAVNLYLDQGEVSKYQETLNLLKK